ncbi:hypothetical protein PGB28_03145 [Primorskyibacter aestuariivivens]|uniref:hypothetical protein n=1 Tax=Primorskyibacter aestuariivivens TaxID=1888912 RepID=UPI0023015A62|nr:hypothetical protein [Primorskyibacter aestuariivivens]MDA7427442.1 hypothetical protein [Primorskyibacter aestuariivivens]
MKRCLRPFFGLFLALVLTITAQTMAVARSVDAPAGEMVLCTGSGPVVVQFDAEGNPVGPVHYCPDCALAMFDTAAPVVAVGVTRVWADLSLSPVQPLPVPASPLASVRARGPPVSV